jgi:uncharacterized protein YerC
MAADRSGATQRDRHLPFGLQLLLAAGIILLILGVARQLTVVPAKQEFDAVRALRKLDCGVEWRDPVDEIKTPVGTYRRSWFTGILGENYFRSIGRVGLRRSVTDELVSQISQLRSYEEAIAMLRGTSTTDADIERLAGISRLRVADLAVTQTTDKGVEALTAASELEVIDLEHTRVTDQSAARALLHKHL